MTTDCPSISSCGFELKTSSECFGELRPSQDVLDDADALQQRLASDGYLYIPGFFDRDDVLAVRDDLLARLGKKGALDPLRPEWEGAVSATPAFLSRREIFEDNSLLPSFVFSPHLLLFYERLLGGLVRYYDHIWTRLVRPGKGTPPHCDLPYMGRGTRKVMTAWIPYRDISCEVGGLMVLEKSHTQDARIRNYLESDVDTYCTNRGPYKRKEGWLSTNPVSLRDKFGGRWLTAEFRAGDLLTFSMTTIHASLDNQSTSYRISTDTRYQLASEPIDPRWIGPETEEYAEKNRIGKIC